VETKETVAGREVQEFKVEKFSGKMTKKR